MKILLIGLGSIGTRHLRNLLSLGYRDVTVVSRSGVLPAEFEALRVFKNVEDALSKVVYDAAIICSPTSKHIDSLLPVLNAGIPNIYLEKPICHSLTELTKLDELRLPENFVLGYDLHFDPGFKKVRQLIGDKIIGKLVSANAQVGQYLPDWRPHEDYRKGMSAKKETGGGVMLDLVHEFDYMYQLFGNATVVAALYNNSQALEIETEDVAEVLIRFETGCLGSIHLDYLQQKIVRNCLITGQSGSIKWDLAESKVSWITRQKTEHSFEYKNFERNDRFMAIMKSFLEDPKDERLTSFADGLESLKMVEAAKQSAESQTFVSMSSFKIPQS